MEKYSRIRIGKANGETSGREKIPYLFKDGGMELKKGGIDFNLHDEKGKFLVSIKVDHSKGKKREVSA